MVFSYELTYQVQVRGHIRPIKAISRLVVLAISYNMMHQFALTSVAHPVPTAA